MDRRRRIFKVAYWACGLTSLSIMFVVVDSTVEMTPLRTILGWIGWGLAIAALLFAWPGRVWK